MTILEKIKQIILKSVGYKRLSDNPNSPRYTFINSEETIRNQRVSECKIWYVGDSQELENYYTNREVGGNAQEPIYNRNKEAYYWGITVKKNEQPIKKVHSGVPRAMIDTISNAIGVPMVQCEGYQDKIETIKKENHFAKKLTQESRPLTMVEGWGAWKINFDKELSKAPLFQYYEADQVDYVVKSGKIVAIIYRDYYQIKDKNYVLLETRSVKKNEETGQYDSCIEWELYLYDKSNQAQRVPLDTLEELADLDENGMCIKGLNKILGVPSVYFYDVFNKDYGRSVFVGKLDLFDDIDQCLSQASQTDRVSTPVEYFPVSMLKRDGNGNTTLPNVYNRQFVAYEDLPNGDGEGESKIHTSQPSLNYSQYIERYNSLIRAVLTGWMSPASMGFDVSLKDNASAQREKEKVTMFTVSNVVDEETNQLKDLFEIALIVMEYMETGKITKLDYDISIKYNEFAAPTFDSMVQTLLPLFSAGGISTEMYVDKLYGDSLSKEEKDKEIAKLDEMRKSDNLNLEEYGINELDEERINEDSSREEEAKE